MKYYRETPAAVIQAGEASLSVQGAKLFTLLPMHIQDLHTGTTEQFKEELHSWLGNIPKQPTIPERHRSAATNSQVDQATYCCSVILALSQLSTRVVGYAENLQFIYVSGKFTHR